MPGRYTIRSGTPSTSTGSVASSGPTTNATRYVDIAIVSSNRTRTRPFPVGSRETSGPFEIARSPSCATSVTPNTALRSGSSQHGNARRASVDSNCVVAIAWLAPASSV